MSRVLTGDVGRAGREIRGIREPTCRVIILSCGAGEFWLAAAVAAGRAGWPGPGGAGTGRSRAAAGSGGGGLRPRPRTRLSRVLYPVSRRQRGKRMSETISASAEDETMPAGPAAALSHSRDDRPGPVADLRRVGINPNFWY